MKKYYKVITYGCQMNVHESEKLAGMLESLEYVKTEKTEQADIIVFNTCTIREGAVDKAFGNIGALKKLKKEKPDLIVAVGGCMPQNKEDAVRVKNTFPFVSIIFGTHNLHEFKNYLLEYINDPKRQLKIWDTEGGVPTMTEINRSDRLNAWVNIMYGCNNFCSYCIVPYVRGRERSREVSDIVNECSDIIKNGYKSITLLGQNVNSFGNDKVDENINFANLLKEIASLPGNFRLKFMTSHPKDLTDEVIKVIKEEDKISKAIHLPVQSGSNEILKTMNRKYTVEHYKNLVSKIRQEIPNVSLSSDFIVGFPGETEQDFDATYNLVKETKFDTIFAYMYSPRAGTQASKMTNQVEHKTKNLRVNKLLALQKEVTKQKRENLIGRVYDWCLVEEVKKQTAYAKTDAGKIIEFKTKTKKVGDFVSLQVTSSNGRKTTGKLI